MKTITAGLVLMAFVTAVSGCKKGQSVTRTTDPKSPDKLHRGKTLVAFEIMNIRLIEVPRYAPSGERWDPLAPLSGNPDVYVKLVQKDRTIYRSEVRQDIAFDGVIALVKDLPFVITSYSTAIRLEVFDEDGVSGDDNMGYFTFNLNDYVRKDLISLSNTEGTLRVDLDIRRVYEK